MNWTRSNWCSADRPQCVEIATVRSRLGGRQILMRDSKLGDASPVERFTRHDWRGFLRHAHWLVPAADGMFRVGDLAFNEGEWRAFLRGVRDGEFALTRLH